MKGKTFVNILVSNYTNKHITLNKGEYVGHLEPPIEEISQSLANLDTPTMHTVLQWKEWWQKRLSQILSSHTIIR